MANHEEDTKTCLKQIYGENLNKRFVLNGAQILIGRAVKADIKLQCPNVSRKHCILNYTEKGWSVKDNNSQNGTYINGRKLKPDESHLLLYGDLIFLGPPAEMPEAFCCEVFYKSEKLELSKKSPEKLEESIVIVSPEKCAAEKEMSNKLTQIPGRKSCRKQILSSQNPDLKSDCEEKMPKRTRVNYKMSKKTAASEKNSGDLENVAAPSSNKRKVQSAYETCSSPIKGYPFSDFPKDIKKKTRTSEEDNESLNLDQINEISSTDNQVNDSLSLLDNQSEDASSLIHCTDEIDRPGCSHNNNVTEEAQTETELLKSKLAAMSAELEKLKKVKQVVMSRYHDASKKNKILDQKLGEQQRLQEDLESCELRAKNEVKKELLDKFEEDLICNICTELLIKPTVLDCSHTFCEFCIKEWKRKKNECPICRKKIENMTRVLTLEHFIDKTVQTLTPEQRDKRDELINQRSQAENLKKAPRVSPRRAYSRRRRRVVTRNRNQGPNFGGIPIPLPETRVSILPLQLPTFLLNGSRHYRVPEVVLSDNEEIDTLNIYLSH